MSVVVRGYKGSKSAWQVDIRLELPNGRKIRERRKSPLTSKSGAQRWGEARERELYEQATKLETPERKLGPTLNAFTPDYLAYCAGERQKPSTLDFKRININAWLKPRFGDKRLGEFTKADFVTLKSAMQSKAPSTTNGIARLLTNMLAVAIELDLIDAAPKYKALKLNQAERGFYEPASIDQLCAAAADEQLVMVLLGVHAGLRAGEMLGLEWSDVEWDRNRIFIQRAVWNGQVGLPKHGKTRRVPMSKRLRAALRSHQHLRHPRVLLTGNGRPLRYRMQVAAWLRDVEAAAGFPVLGETHLLRHSYLSNLAAAGTPMRVLMELAGHSKLQTTQRYLHLSPGVAEDAVSALDRPAPDFGTSGETPIGKSAS